MYANAAQNPYQIEHVELFKAIRSGSPINSGSYMAGSTLMGIMGQLSSYTGKAVSWDQVSTSDFHYPPRPEDCAPGHGPAGEAPRRWNLPGIHAGRYETAVKSPAGLHPR